MDDGFPDRFGGGLTASEQVSTCSTCGAPAPLRVENLVAGRMLCPRCGGAMREVVRRIGICPHGHRVVVWPDRGEPCARCADGASGATRR